MTEKYAVGEYERRFVLREVPDGATNPRSITDHYINDSRLRLRLVTADDDRDSRKLGHKRRIVDDDPTQIMHTSMYLDDKEVEVLSQLPHRLLTKTRWAIEVGGSPCSVNEFTGDLAGLILLEIDAAGPAERDLFTPPPWAGAEVTNDERFTGGDLAGRRFDEIAELVAALLAG